VVIFTGVGKSGLIGQKICQTLVSTGTKAVFLSPQVGCDTGLPHSARLRSAAGLLALRGSVTH
jgi:D-arabinose 5-phosphate isomerase GutQ